MNTHWLRSNEVLLSFLAASMVTVGVLAFLVVRQEQDRATGKEQVYPEATGSAGTNPLAPLTGAVPPQAVNSDGGSADLVAPHPAGNPEVDTFSSKPNNPSKPSDPGKAGHPANPGQPKPGKPHEPPQARQTQQSAARPAIPPNLQPANPNKSNNLDKPNKNNKITKPDKSNKQAKQDNPGKPSKPVEPRKPGDAAELGYPANIGGGNSSDPCPDGQFLDGKQCLRQDMTDSPSAPNSPSAHGKAPTTNTPSRRDTSGSADTPASPDSPGTPNESWITEGDGAGQRGRPSEAVIEEWAEGAGGDE